MGLHYKKGNCIKVSLLSFLKKILPQKMARQNIKLKVKLHCTEIILLFLNGTSLFEIWNVKTHVRLGISLQSYYC